MIAVVRIKGQVGIEKGINQTLDRLKLMKKYVCVVIAKPSENDLGMIKKVRDFVAFGEIDEKTLSELIEKRGQSLEKDKEIDSKKIVEKMKKGKKLKELGVKPFFRLHPPRGGIDSKKHFGKKKGVLGDNKEKINDLIRRML